MSQLSNDFPVEIRRSLKIVTGGQSGVDRAAMDVAQQLGLELGGWCPRGRGAEDGPIPLHYPLSECHSETPAVRTEKNVIDSDGTLIITREGVSDGTPLTLESAQKYNRPCLVLSLDAPPDINAFWRWIQNHDIKVLNIAGPRESFAPGRVYARALEIITTLMGPTHGES